MGARRDRDKAWKWLGRGEGGCETGGPDKDQIGARWDVDDARKWLGRGYANQIHKAGCWLYRVCIGAIQGLYKGYTGAVSGLYRG